MPSNTKALAASLLITSLGAPAGLAQTVTVDTQGDNFLQNFPILDATEITGSDVHVNTLDVLEFLNLWTGGC
ncbi:MAG: hypothetical protein Q9O74_06170 [Planctomycetota bacterium]|nr:hypothetical protein [Planctomycetota bacterium]